MTSSLTLIKHLFLFSMLSFIKSQYDYKEPASQWKSPCGSGLKQSPVNFPKNYTLYSTGEHIRIVSANYSINGKINGTFISDKYSYSIKNNETVNNWGFIIVKKAGIEYKYDLSEIMFHITSEHKFNGLSGDVEMQIKHTKNQGWIAEKNIAKDPDAINTNLNIGVLMKVASYKDNEVFNGLSFKENDKVVNFNVASFLPLTRPFLFYEGSQTIPNCEENVNWIVNHEMVKISKEQFDAIRSWLDGVYTSLTNNRRTQNKTQLEQRVYYYQFYPPTQ